MKIENLYEFKNPDLLKQALTHKSFNQNKKNSEYHNERLEYLGDAVLDLVIGEYLFSKYPEEDEGCLSKKRAMLVREEILGEVGFLLRLQEKIYLGKGEEKMGGATRARLLASAFEAYVGALFLDGGFEEARRAVLQIFQKYLEENEYRAFEDKDYKSKLQEYCQQTFKQTPQYKVYEEEGPSHDRVFKIAVFIENSKIAVGYGKTKKKAEQEAAQKALEKLQNERESLKGGI